MIPLWAGFECGHLFGNHDLLTDTRHTPDADMADHYREAREQGALAFRDGLPWRHNMEARVDAAPHDATIIWDLCHFDPPPNPTLHVARALNALFLTHRPRILSVNEPSIWPRLCGRPREEGVALALQMMEMVSASRGDALFYTCDPFHHLNEDEFAATDALVAAANISTVGVNYYPHETTIPLGDVLRAVHARYGLPVAVTETGWHDGHPRNHHWPQIAGRHGWLDYVMSEAATSGVAVEGVCWYPWLDTPVWGQPGAADRWPCGFPRR